MHIRQSFVQCGANFYNNSGVQYFSQLNSKLRICLTFDEDWDHVLWIQSQISAKTKPYPYSDLTLYALSMHRCTLTSKSHNSKMISPKCLKFFLVINKNIF